MGLELVADYSRQRNADRDKPISMIRHTEEVQSDSDHSAEIITNSIIMTKTDLILNKLNDLEREMDSVKGNVKTEGTKLAYMNKDLTRTVNNNTKKTLLFTKNSMRDLDESLERLPSGRSVSDMRKLLLVTMSVSIVNLVTVLVLALYIFGYIK